jgi:hypothetical protein
VARVICRAGWFPFLVIADTKARSAGVSLTLYCFSLIARSPPTENIGFYYRDFSKISLLVV